jgi:hypothetical protein
MQAILFRVQQSKNYFTPLDFVNGSNSSKAANHVKYWRRKKGNVNYITGNYWWGNGYNKY